MTEWFRLEKNEIEEKLATNFENGLSTDDVARKLEVPNLFMVINKALTSYDFDALRKQVEEIYGAKVAAILPLSEDVARLQSSDIFALRYPEHPFSKSIRNIVALVKAI